MRAESLVRQELRRIDDLVAARRRKRLAAVGRVDAILFKPSHTFFATDRSLAVGAPGAVIVLRSQVAVVEHSHAVHGVALRLRNLRKLLAVDVEVDSPVVKAQDLRRIVSCARKNLEFRRSIAEHQVHRLGYAIVGNARVRMHLTISAMHPHLKRHDHIGIFREHRRKLLYMFQHPFMFRRHVATPIVPRVITDAHNHIALVRADIVEGLLQDIQRIFRQVLALAPGSIFLVASLFNAQPGTTAEFRNFGTQMQQLAIRFFNRLCSRGLEVQHLRRIESAVIITERRHRIGRIDILLHEASRQNGRMQKCKRQGHKSQPLQTEKTGSIYRHTFNIYFFRHFSQIIQIKTFHIEI